ncbi:MAG: hypothetical protein ACTSYI_15315 [Promethearchaeota archaeon]
MAEKEETIVDVDVETDEEKEAKAAQDALHKKLSKTKVKKGDWVFVDILGKTIEEEEKHNIVFQASNPEDAKSLPNYDPEKSEQYIPELAILGEKGFLMDNIDEAIVSDGKLKFFQEKVIKLEPADAFGIREGKKIEKVNARQFIKDMGGEKPYPGATYKDKKGRSGTVLRANQGRLIVDFNHPLAGKKVEYTIKVTDKIEGFENQVKTLLVRRLGGMQSMKDEFILTMDKETQTLEIEIPQMLMFQLAQQQGGIYFKMGTSMDIQEHFKDIEIVKFSEVFKRTPSPVPQEHDHDHDHDEEKEKVQDAEIVEDTHSEE